MSLRQFHEGSYATECTYAYLWTVTKDGLGGDQQRRHIGAMRITRKFNQDSLLEMLVHLMDHRA